MKPAELNDSVHYVSHGTPVQSDGTQAYRSVCRAADVTEVDPGKPERVGLLVKNPTGLFFHSLALGGCNYDAGVEYLGDPNCPSSSAHGNPFHYCSCGWIEASYAGGTWHWAESCIHV